MSSAAEAQMDEFGSVHDVLPRSRKHVADACPVSGQVYCMGFHNDPFCSYAPSFVPVYARYFGSGDGKYMFLAHQDERVVMYVSPSDGRIIFDMAGVFEAPIIDANPAGEIPDCLIRDLFLDKLKRLEARDEVNKAVA